MAGKEIKIKPNIPVFVCLKDPRGDYWDDAKREARYETTTGDYVWLPRQGVGSLFMADPQPGEQIVITQHWDGHQGSSREWTVALSTQSELARSAQEDSQDLTGTLEASIRQVEERKAATPIRRPVEREAEPEQPKLFDRRGTGTHGPAPAEAPTVHQAPAPQPVARYQKPGQIPANVAVREILAFIAIDPNTRNWSDQARQDLASTVIIAAYKAGQVGLWERGE